jgi:putative FmdB family regulatory protein
MRRWGVPLYDYRCTTCRRNFESLLDRWDSPEPPCPHCGAATVQRELSVFAVGAASEACDSPRRGSGVGPCGSSGCACRPASN